MGSSRDTSALGFQEFAKQRMDGERRSKPGPSEPIASKLLLARRADFSCVARVAEALEILAQDEVDGAILDVNLADRDVALLLIKRKVLTPVGAVHRATSPSPPRISADQGGHNRCTGKCGVPCRRAGGPKSSANGNGGRSGDRLGA
jgi:hypothetical protein